VDGEKARRSVLSMQRCDVCGEPAPIRVEVHATNAWADRFQHQLGACPPCWPAFSLPVQALLHTGALVARLVGMTDGERTPPARTAAAAGR